MHDKLDGIAAHPTTETVKKPSLKVNVERGGFLGMEGTQAFETVSSTSESHTAFCDHSHNISRFFDLFNKVLTQSHTVKPTMHQWRFRRLFALLGLFFLTSAPTFVGAQSFSRAQSNLSAQIQKQYNAIKQMETRKKEIQLHLQKSYSTEKDVLQKNKEVSQEIQTLHHQIHQTTQQMEHTERVLDRQTQKVQQLQAQIAEDQQSIQERIRSIYRFLKGKQALPQGQFPTSVSHKQTRFIEQILNNEVHVLQTYQNKRQSLKELLNPYHQRQELQQRLYHKKTSARQALEQKQQEHQRLLLNLQQDQQVYYRYLDELQQSMESATATLDDLQHQQQLASAFKTSKGLLPLKRKLLPPVEGRVLRPFKKQKQNTASPLYHGITIETTEQAFVSAIAPGKVVFAEPLKGYQHLVIIDHGRNSFSVYGHLTALKVNTRTYVDQGTPLGKVTQEPITSKFHTYFEIRHKGRSSNPLSWFKPGTYQ